MTMLSPRREVGEFKKRYKWMALVTLLAFGVLIVRMMQLQILEHGEWKQVARENITKTIKLPATRGLIRDTGGRLIATNQPSYSVYITPQLLDPERDIDRIAELMELDAEQKETFEKRVERVPPPRRTHQIEMFHHISRDQLAALETHSAELPGVDVVAVPERRYPYERLGAHAVGYLNEISSEELEELADRGYRRGQLVGRTGVERAWESYLRGKRGYLRVPVDARGRRLDGTGPGHRRDLSTRTEPVPGRDLTLTMDMDLMKSIERAFRGHPSGGVVVAEVQTGRVRALFSKPAYDLNEMSGKLSTDRFQELSSDPFRPLIDKTVYETYFPGSTFKPLASLAALGDDILESSKRFDCPGFYELGRRKFRCTHAHGEVDMHEALVQSCNVYFYRLSEQVGINRLARYAREFGLGRPTGLGINSESSGFIATRDWYIEQWGEPYRLGFTLNSAIGQGNTRATLIQLAMAYASFANGGKLYVPQLVEEVREPDGEVIEQFQPRVRREVDVPKEQLDFTLEALQGAVNNPDGTAYGARIEDGVRVAGKTGTAQVPSSRRAEEDPERAWYYRRDHAWFAGLAPAEDPEVVVVVVVEHGGAGGKTAAPIAMRVLQEYLGDRVAQKTASAAGARGASDPSGDR